MSDRPVQRVAAVVAAVLYCGVAAFQVALVVGAPWGALTQGGVTDGALPATGRVVAAVSAVVVSGFALALLARVGLGPLARRRWTDVAAWAATVYAVLAVALNAASPSASERSLWLPVALLLVVSSATTVLGDRRRAG